MANTKKEWNQIFTTPKNLNWSIQYIERLKIKNPSFETQLKRKNTEIRILTHETFIKDTISIMSLHQPELLKRMKQAFYQKESRESKKSCNATINITLKTEDKEKLLKLKKKLKLTYGETISALLHNRDKEIEDLRSRVRLGNLLKLRSNIP